MVTTTEIFKITSDALAITGPPEWDSPDGPGVRDALIYIDDDADEDGPLWCLAPTGSDDADYVPIDTAMAHALIKTHLRSWLLGRSWQIQVTVQKNAQHWRLVDCLAIVDGGGDRLDQDYPCGDDELAVLCESVAIVATSAR